MVFFGVLDLKRQNSIDDWHLVSNAVKKNILKMLRDWLEPKYDFGVSNKWDLFVCLFVSQVRPVGLRLVLIACATSLYYSYSSYYVSINLTLFPMESKYSLLNKSKYPF